MAIRRRPPSRPPLLQNRSASLLQLVCLSLAGFVHSFSAPPPRTNTWRSGISDPSANAREAIKNLCQSTPCRQPDPGQGETALAFLFVSQKYNDMFEELIGIASDTLGKDTTLLSVVGGGVIGGGTESDDPTIPAMSLLCGILPSSAGLEVFMFGPDEAPPPSSSEAWKAIGRGQDMPSYVVFADGFAPIQSILEGLDSSGKSGAVVAGGLSCPTFGVETPTIAINGKGYPRGSAVGVGFSGSVGLQAVTAQGCRPVGPPFGVTEADGSMVEELENKPAMEIMKTIVEGDYLTDEDKALVEANGLLCGFAARGESSTSSDVTKGDYLIRQIIGFRVPGFMVGGEAKKGDILRFHVRDRAAALEDMENMIGRAKTERSFAGSQNAGVPLAALQFSCVARGRPLFGSANVDLENISELVGKDAEHQVGGFFANGELGPVGIAGVGLGHGRKTHIHAFTTIAATICDFSCDGGGNTSMKDDGDDSGGGVGSASDDLLAWG